jgi:hypothetical protein
MRFGKQDWMMVLGFLAVLGGVTGMASAQITSSTASVALTATLSESLTVSATPGAVTFALVKSGVATGSAPVAITTTWNTSTVEGNLELDGYFSSASAALTYAGSPAVNIPSSAVLGQVTTGLPTSYTPFTQTGNVTSATASGALALFNVALSSANRAGTRTDNLGLEINLSSLPQIPAATYTGTLILQAQAY